MGNEEKTLANAQTAGRRPGRTGRLDPSGARQPQQTLRVLDLFSGIGGFSLGLERAGMRTVAFCEIDPYCRRVLAKHWPDVPVFGDIRELRTADGQNYRPSDDVGELGGEQPRPSAKSICDTKSGNARRFNKESRTGRATIQGTAWKETQPLWQHVASSGIDLICGGFPCQDISVAGKRAGIEGSRSGLWSEYARIIGEVRPRYALIENVSNLLAGGNGRWFEQILCDLAALGFDAEWHCIRAADVGAPHLRDRVWIIANPQHTDTDRIRSYRTTQHINGSAEFRDKQIGKLGSLGEALAHPDKPRLERWFRTSLRECSEQRFAWTGGPSIPDADGEQAGRITESWSQRSHWEFEPNVGRVAHGVPARVDRLRSLGNAIVPQIAEIIGKAIVDAENASIGRSIMEIGTDPGQ